MLPSREMMTTLLTGTETPEDQLDSDGVTEADRVICLDSQMQNSCVKVRAFHTLAFRLGVRHVHTFVFLCSLAGASLMPRPPPMLLAGHASGEVHGFQ
jgi:hypothetical protein